LEEFNASYYFHKIQTEEDGPVFFAKILSQDFDVFICAVELNEGHFSGDGSRELIVTRFHKDMDFKDYHSLIENTNEKITLKPSDVVLYRIDRPVNPKMLAHHAELGCKAINSPQGILKTTSKGFMVNFRDCCPDFEIVESEEELIGFLSRYPKSVLKPLDGYGGAGVVKVDLESCKDNNAYPIMVMEYLESVHLGDKRILVINGKIVDRALLRMPRAGEWLCNVAQGASIREAMVDETERELISKIDPIFKKEGIHIYGVDTLVDSDGCRIISEVNTTNSGGFLSCTS